MSRHSVPLSVLDLALVKQDGSIAVSLSETLDLARRAEGWNYNRLWLAEHHNMAGVASSATSVVIGYIAAGTSRIRVGSGGIMLPNHAPLVIAEQFGTLETLYPGRIDLGLGRAPGTDGLTLRALRRRPSSADEFPDDVAELLHLLEPKAPNQIVQAVPGAGTRVPVWLLGSSTFSAQLAAHLGLPFAFAAHFAPRLLREALYLYRTTFQPSPYLSKPYSMACIPVMAADTDEQARFLATSLQLRFLEIVRGNKDALLVPPVETMDGRWSESERLHVDMMSAEMIVGDAERVHAKLGAFIAHTKVDELMISCAPFDHAARLRSYEIIAS